MPKKSAEYDRLTSSFCSVLVVHARMRMSRVLSKDRMKLYQHSVRCSTAIQIFLDANPQYWRFVPMTMAESTQSNQASMESSLLPNDMTPSTRTREECLQAVNALPPPPSGLTFSNRQVFLQTQFFLQKRDQHLPNVHIDLYDATIVAVRKSYSRFRFRSLSRYPD